MRNITIIGGGNLGISIAKGLLESNYCTKENLIVTKRNTSVSEEIKSMGFVICNDNVKAISKAEIIILALKPYQLEGVATEIKRFIRKEQQIISVITGIWVKELQSLFNHHELMFRAMPNTAIAIKESMTCIAQNNTRYKELKEIQDLFSNLGETTIIDEQLMDAATVLGACGTAFAMRFIRANIQGGIEIGFSAETATHIAAQTIKGAAELLLTNNSHPEQEIDKVTTPKGCTIAGLNEMEHRGFSSSLIKGLLTSYRKITLK